MRWFRAEPRSPAARCVRAHASKSDRGRDDWRRSLSSCRRHYWLLRAHRGAGVQRDRVDVASPQLDSHVDSRHVQRRLVALLFSSVMAFLLWRRVICSAPPIRRGDAPRFAEAPSPRMTHVPVPPLTCGTTTSRPAYGAVFREGSSDEDKTVRPSRI